MRGLENMLPGPSINGTSTEWRVRSGSDQLKLALVEATAGRTWRNGGEYVHHLSRYQTCGPARLRGRWELADTDTDTGRHHVRRSPHVARPAGRAVALSDEGRGAR